MSFGGPKVPSNTTTTQKTVINKDQRPYVLDLWKLAQGAYGDTPKEGYLGPQFAGQNDWMNEAFSSFYNLGQGAQGIGQPGMDLAKSTIQGNFLNPQTNPWTAQIGQTISDDMARQWEKNILPNIRDSAIASGGYGGSGHTREKIESAYDLSRGTGDVLAKFYGDQYGQERKLQQLAPGLLQQGFQTELMPIQAMLSGGQGFQQGEQIDINNIMAQVLAAQQQPWIGLPQYQSLVGSPFGGGGTTTTSGQGTSAFGSALQGGIGGAALAGAVGSAVPATSWLAGLAGPWGVAGGALAGGLLGLVR